MTGRERVALLFLTATFLLGAGVTLVKRVQATRAAAREPLVIENPVDTAEVVDVRIDVNRAEAWELERLPGIGPKLSQRIIEYREKHGRFGKPEGLLQVSGIGPKKLEAIRDLVKCGETSPDSMPAAADSLP
jgi:competence ComEA-like helix-hairpin-helix protein